jgi:hypothetical protein
MPGPSSDETCPTAVKPHPLFRGVPCRASDQNPARALYHVAKLFRAMSGLTFLLMVVQVGLGLTSAVELSYGVLFGEAVRLLVAAGVLWAAGDLSDLFVKSHCDILAMRISLARIAAAADTPHASPGPAATAPRDGPRLDAPPL